MDIRQPPYTYQRLDRTPGVWIQLWSPENLDTRNPFLPKHSLTDTEADAIMQWTMEHKVGVRMSFDMWKFRNEAELTVFILKWC